MTIIMSTSKTNSQAFATVAEWTCKLQFNSSPLSRSHRRWAQERFECARWTCFAIVILFYMSTNDRKNIAISDNISTMWNTRRKYCSLQWLQIYFYACIVTRVMDDCTIRLVIQTYLRDCVFSVEQCNRNSANSLFVEEPKPSADFLSFQSSNTDVRSLICRTEPGKRGLPLAGAAMSIRTLHLFRQNMARTIVAMKKEINKSVACDLNY